jgi:hypothetical protein
MNGEYELFGDLAGLSAKWKDILDFADVSRPVIKDERSARGPAMDELIYNAVFNQDRAVLAGARELVASVAAALGAQSASIRPLYLARGQGEVHGFTVPAINLRGLTYDLARAAFRVAKRTDAAAMIFELARSEMGYTFQRPSEYASCILAAAVREGWRGPVFLQGDHFQVNAKKFSGKETREPELQAIRDLISETIDARIWNIDIDSSTVVDLSKPTLDEQQADNPALCAHYTQLIRARQPFGISVSVGGEIGEVGRKNSTVEDLDAFMRVYLGRLGSDSEGLSKISVQTGTSHGGIPLPGGGLVDVKVDFRTLAELSKRAREEYGMAGAVQHGASTLPAELFHYFPEVETAEIHLATGFQNIIFDHDAFPSQLREQIVSWCKRDLQGEWKAGMTEAQFVYKTRKKAWGPFKKRIWDLPAKDVLVDAVESQFEFLWKQLNVGGTRSLVERHVGAINYEEYAESHRSVP